MVDHQMDRGFVEEGEPSSSPEGIPAERFSAVSLLSNHVCYEMSLPDATI